MQFVFQVHVDQPVEQNHTHMLCDVRLTVEVVVVSWSWAVLFKQKLKNLLLVDILLTFSWQSLLRALKNGWDDNETLGLHLDGLLVLLNREDCTLCRRFLDMARVDVLLVLICLSRG